MIGFVEGTAHSEVSKELQQATSVLEYLSQAGNSSAEQRLTEIRNFHDHVWPKKSTDRDDMQATANKSMGETTPTAQQSLTDGDPQPPAHPTEDVRDASRQPSLSDSGAQLEIGTDYEFNLDLGQEADGIYSSFHDPQLPLTGVDHLDWAELEKVFSSSQA